MVVRAITRGDVPAVVFGVRKLVEFSPAADKPTNHIIDQMFNAGEFTNPPVIDPATGLPVLGVDGQPLPQEPLSGRTPADKRDHAHVNLHVDLKDLITGTGTGDLDIPGSQHTQVIPLTTVARMCCDSRVTTILEELIPTPMLTPASGNLLATAATKLAGSLPGGAVAMTRTPPHHLLVARRGNQPQ